MVTFLEFCTVGDLICSTADSQNDLNVKWSGTLNDLQKVKIRWLRQLYYIYTERERERESTVSMRFPISS